MSAELQLLKIRNLIAARESNTAQANMETSRDGWLCDHAFIDGQLSVEVQSLVEEIEHPAAQPPERVCRWTWNNADDRTHKTGCNHLFSWRGGFVFCPGCGGQIEIEEVRT